MSTLIRTVFPSMASFGPLFIVLGLSGTPSTLTGGRPLWLYAFALVGALATGSAMLILYKQQVRIHERLDECHQREHIAEAR